MPFHVSQRTLEKLEWPQLLAMLQSHARTPAGQEFFSTRYFHFTLDWEQIAPLLAATEEARELLQSGKAPAFGEIQSFEKLEAALSHGEALSGIEVHHLAQIIECHCACQQFLRQNNQQAPTLFENEEGSLELADLLEAIRFAVDQEGKIRDEASPALREARRDERRHKKELIKKLERMLHHANVAPHLSDSFYTLRNERFVLPVRADARSQISGIVHGASRTGTTLFIEPTQLIELNNLFRDAELRAEREAIKVLLALAETASTNLPQIRQAWHSIERLDCCFARARLADELKASTPELGDAGILRLPGLRHPLIPAGRVEANSIQLGDPQQIFVLSGPNAGG